MRDLAGVRAQLSWRYFFRGQLHHLLLATVLMPGAHALATPSLVGRTFLGLPDTRWVHGLIWIVVAHQVIVWLVFRVQLCFGTLTELLGRADLTVWSVLFFPFLAARLVGTIIIGWLDAGSLGGPQALHVIGGLLLLLPALYTGWSVLSHFGLLRAAGGDHFRDRYREMPLVAEGAFRLSANAMYSFAFLALWALAFFWASRAALALAIFQHAYIWVHWYCTEQPDLAVLYSDVGG